MCVWICLSVWVHQHARIWYLWYHNIFQFLSYYSQAQCLHRELCKIFSSTVFLHVECCRPFPFLIFLLQCRVSALWRFRCLSSTGAEKLSLSHLVLAKERTWILPMRFPPMISISKGCQKGWEDMLKSVLRDNLHVCKMNATQNLSHLSPL